MKKIIEQGCVELKYKVRKWKCSMHATSGKNILLIMAGRRQGDFFVTAAEEIKGT